jgi:hypothetical protein
LSTSLSSSADLLRRLEPRIAAVERRDVAELALVGAAAGELHAAQHVAVELDQVVGRQRELGQRPALVGGEHHLGGGPRRVARQPAHQLVGGIADLADMEIVEGAIVLRRRRHRRPAQHRDPAMRMGAGQMSMICRRWICMPLTKTASAQRKSSAVAGLMFSSTKRTDQSSGSAAAMIRSPCGGMKACTPTSG